MKIYVNHFEINNVFLISHQGWDPWESNYYYFACCTRLFWLCIWPTVTLWLAQKNMSKQNRRNINTWLTITW